MRPIRSATSTFPLFSKNNNGVDASLSGFDCQTVFDNFCHAIFFNSLVGSRVGVALYGFASREQPTINRKP